MAPELFVPILLIGFGPLAIVSILLVWKKLTRSVEELFSAARRERYRSSVRTGADHELVALAEGAVTGARVRMDLAAVLEAELPALAPERQELMRKAACSGGLVRMLETELHAGSPIRRGRALRLAAALGLPSVDAVEHTLFDPDPDVRLAAAHTLSLRASKDGADALLRALREGSMPQARLVERLAAPWAVPSLLSACEDAEMAHVRARLVEALGLAGERAGTGPATRLLAAGDQEERIQSIRALARIGDDGSAHALLEALGDPAWEVRAQAARALGELRVDAALPTLAARLSDPSWWVRANCAESLRALGQPGMAVLETCAHHHRDGFARDRAREALAMETTLRVRAG